MNLKRIIMNKKLIFLLLSLLAMTACHDEDEPDMDKYFQNLDSCPALGVYQGIISNMPALTDKSFPDVGVWCEITNAPDDAYEKDAPAARCNIYFKRSDFPNNNLEIGDRVKFRILKFGGVPSDFPFVFFWDRLYYIGIVKPEE